jgi:hypothetical protein
MPLTCSKGQINKEIGVGLEVLKQFLPQAIEEAHALADRITTTTEQIKELQRATRTLPEPQGTLLSLPSSTVAKGTQTDCPGCVSSRSPAMKCLTTVQGWLGIDWRMPTHY